MVIAFKVLLVIVFIALWHFSQRQLGKRKLSVHGEIIDYSHEWTKAINQQIQVSPRLERFLLISSSLILDLIGLFLLYLTIFSHSWRPFLGLVMLFTFRQMCQLLTILPAPKGLIWRHPGVPSILVTYGVSNDLFFSGHTALAVYGAMELTNYFAHQLWLQILIWFLVIYEAIVVLVLRAHWFVDVLAGALAAYWIAHMASLFAPWFDQLL